MPSTHQSDEPLPAPAPVLVDGVALEAHPHDELIDDVLLPALERLRAARTSTTGRTFVFLVAPPGAGKSTLAAQLVQRAGALDLAVVGMDGFHHAQAHLDSGRGTGVPLASVKGAPETFDLAALASHLERVRTEDLCWPRYDRTLHDPVPGREPVTAPLVVVEGTWLLLDEPGWSDLAAHSSWNVFIEAEPSLLRRRLVDRKVRGGSSPSAAVEFYERSDRRNVERVLTRTDRSRIDLLLTLGPDGTLHREATT